MGFGMASPYLIFSLFPNLIIFLPKPGIWMQYIKYFLGILLFGTFVWILSILLNHYSFTEKFTQEHDSNWIDFTTIELENLKHNNNIIFVDITADWCVTCQYNKINVINSKTIINGSNGASSVHLSIPSSNGAKEFIDAESIFYLLLVVR